MDAVLTTTAYLVASVLFILSLRGLSSPETAQRGNVYGVIGMIIAVGLLIDNAIEFTFPTDFALKSGESVYVGSVEPELLRELYDLDANTLVLGPFDGKLNNAGESLQLYRPDPPQTLPPDIGLVPYILVDRVKFRDSAPWPPQADGRGATLQRKTSTAFGNDPVNWKADAPTPGRDNRRSEGEDSDGDGIPDEWEEANGLNPIVAADAA